MSAPQSFDPAAYIADMRETGAAVYPFVSKTTAGTPRRAFGIGPGRRGGIPGEVLFVGSKWAAAALAHPDWVAAVHDALEAEGRAS